MKVKIFQWVGSFQAEVDINAFLASGVKVVNLVQTSCACTTEGKSLAHTCITILYEVVPTILDYPLSALDLSVRAYGSLTTPRNTDRPGIEPILTVGQLTGKTANQLLKYLNFGKISLNEIKAQLAKYHLHLKDEISS